MTDHILPATIKRLASDRPMLRFIAPEYLLDLLTSLGVERCQIDVIADELVYKDYMTVKRFDLIHDVPNSGYIITLADGTTIMYATDTASLEHITAPNLDYYFIEDNYDEDEIRERIAAKLEAGGYIYEYRVLETHLSMQKAKQWIAQNAKLTSMINYIHQHK